MSRNKRDEAEEKRRRNTRIVLDHLAKVSEANQYDIMKATNLRYPRVSEAVAALVNRGFVRKVGEKIVKNGLPSSTYGLTFKGTIQSLSSVELREPEKVFWHGESQEEIRKRYLSSNNAYCKEIENLMAFLQTKGKALAYPIFAEIDWLVNNFGTTILQRILHLAEYCAKNPLSLFKAIEKHERLRVHEITGDIETMKKLPFLQKGMQFTNDGIRREEKEIDYLADSRKELAMHEDLMLSTLESENTALKKAFASQFFEELGLFYRTFKPSGGNEHLAALAKGLLEERRKSLDPLEIAVGMFEKE